ncbi:hypothetical protein ASF91_13230 [Rhizobium sp. Leaf155]|jgi:hypothetical protein|nr:hypothetical protein ASF91_13230 [Rhizobium sp. Leaf155]
MANKGGSISEETKAKISASQKARWERIRAKVQLGETHETRCNGTEAAHIAYLIQRFRNWIKS